MRNLAALLLVVTASCAAEQIKPVDLARKSFEAWVKATAAGDVDKNFDLLSDSMKSEWLYDRLEENDGITRRWRGELGTWGATDEQKKYSARARTDLDLWWGIAHRNGSGRPEPLRQTVLDHPTFITLFKEYFAQSAKAIKSQFGKLEIVSIYGDDTGITVVVRSGAGAPSEMYGMSYEHDNWRINTYRPPLASQK